MPDIDTMSPRSGRVIKDDNTIINIADLAGGNDATFHSAVSATGNGTSYNVNGFKVLTLSCTGTNTSRSIEVHGVDFNGVDNILPGFNITNFAQVSTLTTKDLSMQYAVEGLKTVYAKITAIGGGNATIKGTLTT